MKYFKFIFILFFLISILNAKDNKFIQLKNIAIQYVNNERFQDGLRLLSDYKKKNPYDYRIYIEIAGIYQAMNDHKKGEQTYLEGIKVVTNCSPDLYHKLGMLYYSSGDYGNAFSSFKELINCTSKQEMKSDYKKSYKAMGISCFLLFDFENSIKYFNLSRKFNYKDEEIYKYLSVIYKKKADKDYSQAYLELSNLLIKEKNIKEDDFYYKMGSVFFNHNKYKDSKESLLKIYDRRSRDCKINFNLGLACYFTDEYKESIKYLEKAAKYYEKKFSIKKIFNKFFHIDNIGAKYHLALRVSYFMNKEFPKADKIGLKIKEYDKSMYKKYKDKIKLGNDSKLYKELKDSWEY